MVSVMPAAGGGRHSAGKEESAVRNPPTPLPRFKVNMCIF